MEPDNIENSKPSTSNDALSTRENTNINCKSCGGDFVITNILKHIAHMTCEEQYPEQN